MKGKTTLAVVLGAGVALSGCGGVDDKPDAALNSAIKQEMSKPIVRNSAEALSASENFSAELFEEKVKKAQSKEKEKEKMLTQIFKQNMRISHCFSELFEARLNFEEIEAEMKAEMKAEIETKIKAEMKNAQEQIQPCSNKEILLVSLLNNPIEQVYCNSRDINELTVFGQNIAKAFIQMTEKLESQGTQLCPYMSTLKMKLHQLRVDG